jgi:hypothetical protein
MTLLLRSASTTGGTSAAPDAGTRQDATTGERPVQLDDAPRTKQERGREARTRTWSGDPGGGDDDEAVLLRLAGREEVLQRPLQRVVAVVALVHPHHHGHLPRRRRRSIRRHGSTGPPLRELPTKRTKLNTCLLAWRGDN